MKVAIINCFETYEIRERWIHSFFTNRGDNVEVIKSNFLHMSKEKILIKNTDCTYLDVKPYHKNLSISRLKSHYAFSKNVIKYLEQKNFDLLYVLIPPNSLVKDCVKFKRKKKVKIIFDFIDLWPETMPVKSIKNIFPFSLWKNIRDNYISEADYIVTQCDLYHQILSQNIDEKEIKTIYFIGEQNALQNKINLDDDSITLCYLGSINNIIDIDKIGEIINHISKIKPVTLKIIGDGEKKHQLIETSKLNGANVIDYGKIYDLEEKQLIFNTCNYGLNIYKSNTFIGMTMKSLDYLYGNLPIINNIQYDTKNIIDKYKVGINVIDGINVEEILDNSASLRANINQCICEVFSREINLTKLENILSDIGGE